MFLSEIFVEAIAESVEWKKPATPPYIWAKWQKPAKNYTLKNREIDWSYCNRLTSFECEADATTGNGTDINLLKLVLKKTVNLIFGSFLDIWNYCAGARTLATSCKLKSWELSSFSSTSCNLPLVAVHHFCLTKGFQKTPNYSAIYRLESHLTVFYIAQIMPSFVVLYLNAMP